MAQFDLITKAPDSIRQQSRALDRRYYQIDTASNEETTSWIDFNPFILTHAVLDDEHFGYFNLMPITSETVELMERQEVLEEDLLPEHILAPDVMRYAQYFYLPAITVKDYTKVRSRMAVAALISGLASYLLNVFTPERIKRIYANPTTFQGNQMLRRLGFRPAGGVRKLLRGNDIYYIDVTPETIAQLRAMHDRYARFVHNNCWEDPALLNLLSGKQ